VQLVRAACFASWANSLNAHQLHQPLYKLTVDFVTKHPKIVVYKTAAPCKCFHIMFIISSISFKFSGYIDFFLVLRGLIDIQQPVLSENIQALTGRLNHFLLLFVVQKPDLRYRKSFSTFSCPICR
jgi:hypothetical protein